MCIYLSIPRLRHALAIIWLGLIFFGVFVEVWKYVLYLDDTLEFIFFFGLSYEQNLPTWYSSSLLLVCCIQLGLIAAGQPKTVPRYRKHWWGLCFLFGYISLDEAVTLHEDLSKYFDLDGIFYFGWVIPGIAAVAVLGTIYLPFLWHLPSRTRFEFVRSGVIYVSGALGVELLLGYWTDKYGTKNLGYGLIDVVEESMEILGLSLFALALLRFLGGPKEQFVILTAPQVKQADVESSDDARQTPQ